MSDEILPQAAPVADCWASAKPKSPCAAEKRISDKGAASGRGERFASFGALLSAFIASSWCWLPPLLILGGISGAGMTTILQDYRPIFIFVTFGFLGTAFYLTYRPRRADSGAADSGTSSAASNQHRSKIMTLNKVMLWAVTLIAVVFLFFPQTVTNLFAANNEITADMNQTVIQIEGMTWHTWAPKAERAIKAVPGVLAVKVDYEAGQATIGTEKGREVPKAEILAALETQKYRGKFVSE